MARPLLIFGSAAPLSAQYDEQPQGAASPARRSASGGGRIGEDG